MFPFFATTCALGLAALHNAANSLATAWYPEDRAWAETANALECIRGLCSVSPLKDWAERSRRIDRAQAVVDLKRREMAATELISLGADVAMEVNQYEAFLIPPHRRLDCLEPLHRFAASSQKFSDAVSSMEGAGKCLAYRQWDASVFYSMRVLENGLRWLASRFPNLTLKKPIEYENWENIIGNIQARIDEELRRNAPRTPQRDEDLAFYGRAAAEFRYFKDAWRNHVMHDRNDPYDEFEAERVLVHVASFMEVLAVRA